MAGFTCCNMLLLWLTLVTPYLLSGLDALPVTDEVSTTVETVTANSTIDAVTANSTIDTEPTNSTIETVAENSSKDASPTNLTNCTTLDHVCNDKECIIHKVVCDTENHCNDENCQSNNDKTVVNKEDVDAEQEEMLFRDVTNQKPEPEPWQKPPPTKPPY